MNLIPILILAAASILALALFVADLLGRRAKRQAALESAELEARLETLNAAQVERLRPALARSNSREILEGLAAGSLIAITRKPHGRGRSFPTIVRFLALEPSAMKLEPLNPFARAFRRPITDLCYVERPERLAEICTSEELAAPASIVIEEDPEDLANRWEEEAIVRDLQDSRLSLEEFADRSLERLEELSR